ncbi:hypothetical protein KC357_g135 [Hortaea werneckii]|nr:hypothetical protein KC357_g135 [Hortaea werneckii]
MSIFRLGLTLGCLVSAPGSRRYLYQRRNQCSRRLPLYIGERAILKEANPLCWAKVYIIPNGKLWMEKWLLESMFSQLFNGAMTMRVHNVVSLKLSVEALE